MSQHAMQDAPAVLSLFQRSRGVTGCHAATTSGALRAEARFLAAYDFLTSRPGIDIDRAILTQFLTYLVKHHRAGLQPSWISDHYELALDAHRRFARIIIDCIGCMEPCRRCRRFSMLVWMCRALGGLDLGMLDDSEAAALLIDRWPLAAGAPRFHTARLNMRYLRELITLAAEWYGFTSPHLCAQARPRSDSRQERSRPVASTIAFFDQRSPVLTLYPVVLIKLIEELLLTLYWAQVRPFDEDGRMNEKLNRLLVERYEAFDPRAFAFLEEMGLLQGFESMRNVFRICLALALPYADEADHVALWGQLGEDHRALVDLFGGDIELLQEPLQPDDGGGAVVIPKRIPVGLWNGLLRDVLVVLRSGCCPCGRRRA